MTEARNYPIEIQYGNFEGENCYRARANASEFEYLTEFADTPIDAYNLILESIEITIKHYKEKGLEIPIPV